MFKAIGLICSAWIVNGEPKQSCYTHKFRWEFETKRECQIRFLLYRTREKPIWQNIVLGECFKEKELRYFLYNSSASDELLACSRSTNE